MFTHTARKRFGQNFLIDNYIVAEIIAHVNPQPKQHLVEIGPGQGALTTRLLASGAQLDAVELDRDLAEHLGLIYANKPNFKLHTADILAFDLSSLRPKKTDSKLRLIGNLPYNISSPLLFKMFDNIELIEDMYFMLQKEVAERLTAGVNSKEYGRMTVMAQFYCDMEIIIDVPPSAFSPAPKVDSAVVKFVPRAKYRDLVRDPKILQTITTLAFNHRRKTIANAIKDLISAEQLQKINIDPQLRAENLSLQDYCTISNYLED